LIQRCIDDCRRVGFFNDSDPVLTAGLVDMPHAYVVYDHARPKNVATIRDWLLKQDILLAGRYSEWEYYNSDHAFLAGKKAAETARERLRAEVVAQ
jgi:protoporphyrinogen oxidase